MKHVKEILAKETVHEVPNWLSICKDCKKANNAVYIKASRPEKWEGHREEKHDCKTKIMHMWRWLCRRKEAEEKYGFLERKGGKAPGRRRQQQHLLGARKLYADAHHRHLLAFLDAALLLLDYLFLAFTNYNYSHSVIQHRGICWARWMAWNEMLHRKVFVCQCLFLGVD